MRYRMFAGSVPGSKHIKKGWGCQDSSGTCEADCTQIIAIADGHGSSDCFRSEIGSMVAVQTAFSQTKLYCQMACDSDSVPIRFSETGITNFKYSIWNKWREMVKDNWDDYFSKHKLLGEDEVRYDFVSDKYKARYTAEQKSIVEKYLYVAYGTTLLFAVSVGTQLLILQIGDGTCVVLQKNGEFRIPMPADEENFLNVTVSLCEDDAHLKIRHRIIDCDEGSSTAAVAVFLSSDGVDNCFPVYENEQHLYELYTIIIENILKAGYKATETEIMESLLPGLSEKGSQDDISLAFFMCQADDVLKDAFKHINDSYKPKVSETMSDGHNDRERSNDADSVANASL
jgi:hypothetical protein